MKMHEKRKKLHFRSKTIFERITGFFVDLLNSIPYNTIIYAQYFMPEVL